MATVEELRLILKPFVSKSRVLSIQKNRGSSLLIFLIAGASLLSLALSLTSSDNFVSTCKLVYEIVIPRFWQRLSSMFTRPWLCILVVVITMVVTSDVLNPAEDTGKLHPPVDIEYDDEKRQPMKLVLDEPDGEGSEASHGSLRNVNLAEGEVKISDTSHPLKFESVGSEFWPALRMPDSVKLEDTVLFSANEEKSSLSSHRIWMEDFANVQLEIVDGSSMGDSGVQLVRFEEDEGESELTAEEINARAEAFIVDFRKRLSLQRQESLRRKGEE